MKFVVKIAMAAILALTFSFTFAKETQDKAKALVNKVTQDQLTIVKSFTGPGNMVGFVLQPNQGGMPVIMYADQAGQYAVYGNVFDSDGNNLAETDGKKYILPMVTKKIADGLPKTASFTQGKADAKYKLYAVADPNCSACHYLYQEIKPMVASGDVQVTWILVDFLKASSPNRAAAILSAKDPAAAMNDNETHFVSEQEEGGIKQLKSIPKEIKAKLDANMAFFTDSGLSKTPTLIFYNGAGELQFVEGVPRDLNAFFKKTTPSITVKN